MKFRGYVMQSAAAAASFAILAAAFVGTLPAQAQTVMVNGSQLALNPGPIERAGRVFVPLRSIFERLGASVVYQSGTINATKGQRTISLTIGSTQATVDGQPQIVDVAPFIVGATTYVPLRFIAQSLGATVNYNSSTNVVAITHAGGGGGGAAAVPAAATAVSSACAARRRHACVTCAAARARNSDRQSLRDDLHVVHAQRPARHGARLARRQRRYFSKRHLWLERFVSSAGAVECGIAHDARRRHRRRRHSLRSRVVVLCVRFRSAARTRATARAATCSGIEDLEPVCADLGGVYRRGSDRVDSRLARRGRSNRTVRHLADELLV